jgi:hypothetical protein
MTTPTTPAAIARLRSAVERADSTSGLMEPIAVDDARAVLARIDALLDDFQDCDDCDGTGIGPIVVDSHGNVGDEPCSVCGGIGGVQKSAAKWITKWHEHTNAWKSRALAAESACARLRAELEAVRAVVRTTCDATAEEHRRIADKWRDRHPEESRRKGYEATAVCEVRDRLLAALTTPAPPGAAADDPIDALPASDETKARLRALQAECDDAIGVAR